MYLWRLLQTLGKSVGAYIETKVFGYEKIFFQEIVLTVLTVMELKLVT